MDDKEIIELYLQRDETAIRKTKEKYEAYCFTIANNILLSKDDADECVNDAYLKLWNSIPPNLPTSLSAYLGKITRNLSFDKYRKLHADKRGFGEFTEVLNELSECVSQEPTVESCIERAELLKAIESFLDEIPKEHCNIFIMRYWYAMPVAEIAERAGISATNVTTQLSRTRKRLKQYLVRKGYDI